MVSLFDTTPDGHARCAECDKVHPRAKMHARPDGLHLCATCKRAQDKAARERAQTELFRDNSVTGSLF